MSIEDLVMWRHYNVILENSDITMRPWQRLAISDNWNHLSAYTNYHLSAYVIWNILVLNIKGKVNKIAIIYNYGPRKRWISKIVNPTRVISPRALENNPSGFDNFGYSPIQRAVTVLLYRTNSWNILFNIWIVKVLFH
jgi:hypothetical protein